MKAKIPTIIAGPCSAESLEQLTDFAQFAQDLSQVSMIRCGVWKPRTRPGGFDGFGEIALQWISQLRTQGHRFCCEVARPEHVEQALRYSIDALWIGARTTANPFMVQELTEALRGSQIPIMVKNAPSPDVKLWIGAIERCWQVGLADVTAVHRGFDLYSNGIYRNHPLWEVPIELRRSMPELAILCDPSHIAGQRKLVPSVAQNALDLGFDGLFIESHPTPETALTDAGQQLSPQELQSLLVNLIIPQDDGDISAESLRLLRNEIDHIDQQLLQLLADRAAVSCRIAQIKAENQMALFQPKRWQQVLEQRTRLALQLNLNDTFVKELFEKIHAESVRVQEETLGRNQL